MWKPEAQDCPDELCRQPRSTTEGASFPLEWIPCSAHARLRKGPFRVNVQVRETLLSVTAFYRKNFKGDIKLQIILTSQW